MRFPSLCESVLALAATCLIVTAACTTLRPVQPDKLRGPNPPDRVRLTETNDSTVVLRDPQLVGDSLVGMVDSTRQARSAQSLLCPLCHVLP